MSRQLRLAPAFAVTICLGDLAGMASDAVGHGSNWATYFDYSQSLDILTKPRTAVWAIFGVLFLWVFVPRRTSMSSRIAYLAEIVEDGAHELCASVGLLSLLAPRERVKINRCEEWLFNTLCRASGPLGIFIGIVYYSLHGTATTRLAIPRASDSQAIVSSASTKEDVKVLKGPSLSPSTAGLMMRTIRQPFLGSQGVLAFFSVNDLVSAYQWAYHSISAPLDPDAFDMDAYLAMPVKLYPLLAPSTVDSKKDMSLDSLTVYNLLSAYCYATYPIRRLLFVILDFEVQNGLSIETAVVLYCPELLLTVSRKSAGLLYPTSVLHWLECASGPGVVATARIEELNHDQNMRGVSDGLVLPPGSTTSHNFFSTQELLAAFVYVYNRIQGRSIEVRFVCSTLRVVHRNKCADINVHIFNERTRARLITLIEDPPESFRCPREFSRIASCASTTTESSSDDTDAAFPYTDDSDFDYEALHLGGPDLDLDTDTDGSACDSDSDSELEEMTWMLDVLSVDDYPSLYGWELEELVLALQGLTVDDFLHLRDSELEDLLVLLKVVIPDGVLGLCGLDAAGHGLEPQLLSDIEHTLEIVKAHVSVLPEASDLRTALARFDTNGNFAPVPVRTRGDVPASAWKGKRKALALDDLDLDISWCDAGVPAAVPRAHPGHLDAESDASSDDVHKKRKRHRGGKRIPMAERRRRARRMFQETMAPLRDVEFVEGPSWAPEDEKWCEGFGMW